ncbi:hypothetical protein CLV40_11620 [Actinokineospora auranticolor]|uniref:Uncharacterized protein n=1 Tax=Actinokineospora auranticolor TaxID=155976 RepID=A0A2S6GIC0_9PSEU|nr:hypothetical protein CLV40_11620 [Actinokineospora auranticolor]
MWSFYAQLPDTPWPAYQRQRRVDFGPSELGRQRYDLSGATSAATRARWERWERSYTGRRVDLFVRPLPVPPATDRLVVSDALVDWLRRGEAGRVRNSTWHLAR